MDAECTSAAMVALEREGFSTDSRGTAAGQDWTPEIGVDFNGFVAAVRAVLLFEGTGRMEYERWIMFGRSIIICFLCPHI